VINKFYKNCNILCYARGADGELKLASFCSSGILCSAPGRAEFVQLHVLDGVHSVPPQSIYSKKNKEISLFSQKNNYFLFGKTSDLRFCADTGFFIHIKHERSFL